MEFEKYKKYGLNYIGDTIKINEFDGYRESGVVRILECGCVYGLSGIIEYCNNHFDIDKIRNIKIKEIKDYVSETIKNKYGDYYNQLNILNGLNGYSTADKTNYKTFINEIIAKELVFLAEVNNFSTAEDLNSYSFEF